jgi:hypothetical protein
MIVIMRFLALILVCAWVLVDVTRADGLPQGGQIGDVVVRRDANGNLTAVPAEAVAGRILKVCQEGCAFSSIAMALQGAGSGDTIMVEPGVYTTGAVISVNGISLIAKPGTFLQGAVVENKAAIVVKGNNTVIDGIECSDIVVAARFGGCVRLEGQTLTLRHVYFHDAKEGLSTGPNVGQITIEDSLFERLGAKGLANAVDIGATDGVTIRRTTLLASRELGHEVKSHAARTVIEDSVIASLDGEDSRLVDVSNGGEVIIRNSILEKGPASESGNLIGFALEGGTHERNSLTLEGVEIIIDAPSAVLVQGAVQPLFRNVKVVGGEKPGVGSGDVVTWYRDRAAARLEPYPQLPKTQ